jgi:hypothetical protein
MSTTIQSLPRELRQKIFKYAFDDAKEQDIKLYGLLKHTCLHFYHLDTYFSISMLIKSSMTSELKLDWLADPAPRAACKEKIIYAPNLSQLASSLLTAHPGVWEEVAYVLVRALRRFEFSVKNPDLQPKGL